MNTSPVSDPPSELDTCGCCQGLAIQAPAEVYNRPGLNAIQYRIGTHSRFKRSLLARLSNPRDPELRAALQKLNTRDEDDFAIALLDTWATVADVLTFYQERIANEQYLRTAQERLSLLYLARLIGYELRPGVAASTTLAFTLEELPGVGAGMAGVPSQVMLAAGVKAQSVPEPGGQPQIFETVEKIEARPTWNAIRPRLTQPHPRSAAMTKLVVEGGALNLKAGDTLLVPLGGNSYLFCQAAEVLAQPDQGRTEVRLASAPKQTLTGFTLASNQKTPPAPSALASTLLGQTQTSAGLAALAQQQGFQTQELFEHLKALRPVAPNVYVLRTRAAIFGHNAPLWSTLPYSQRAYETVFIPDPSDNTKTKATTVAGVYSSRQNSWADVTNVGFAGKLRNYPGETSTSTNMFLDNTYAGIAQGSWVVLRDQSTLKAYTVNATVELSKSDFTLSGRVTRLTLNDYNGLEQFAIRTTLVYGQPEELILARESLTTEVADDEIECNGWVDGLSAGQKIVVCGELADNRGTRACETATLKEVAHLLQADGYTRLTLSKSLVNHYVRETVTIHANVAMATHGETREEVLGSGDASQAFQSFKLRQPPLTYVKAGTASGAQSTLEVRVNDVLWKEVPDFYGRGPNERVYITRRTDEGSVVVQFGDGKTGARLPTGQENVRARYRRGIGTAGLVKADQISLLMTRPLGIKAVTNPQDTEGAADPESRDDARRNTPLTVMTLDRIVSLRDYEDFARSFAGIAKALATWTWTGQRREVFLTVAGAKGAEVKDDSQTLSDLLAAMHKAGDPLIPIQAKSYLKGFFKLAAQVKIDPDYEPAKVLAAVEAALRAVFSFDQRDFGQPVTLSELIATIQAVKGVIAVNVTKLYRSLETPAAFPPARISPHPPSLDPLGKPVGAELLTLDPVPLSELGVMS
ncbi:MAG: putative baseplate assembly protein [Chloroflexi bacterium]|nr:putative baseplate assembly protein [Chloroflexota bacterium]MCI0578093.1 putative baseplate assembly protein [Chloroflexota bacterium]MCI0646081.1 putative baseplate assembly protein [Chloroflexota bacterium]MCI0730981.1 putative baseplate assembly protein [Chloroflexota bacterium]